MIALENLCHRHWDTFFVFRVFTAERKISRGSDGAIAGLA